MKKTILILLILTSAFLSNAVAQTKASNLEKLKEQIIALEKSGWQAWKNKNAEWFKINTTESFLSVSSGGISNKAEVVKSTATDCDVKTVSLADFTFIMLNKETVVLTYIATQDGVCGNSKLAKVRASATYVKQGGKWLEAFYMETTSSE
ncbi:MAG: nuclear transport factor 2 family protein [Ferruginibacter sp.]